LIRSPVECSARPNRVCMHSSLKILRIFPCAMPARPPIFSKFNFQFSQSLRNLQR
jgi:hypothetical protein